jgi:hypothetical protein
MRKLRQNGCVSRASRLRWLLSLLAFVVLLPAAAWASIDFDEPPRWDRDQVEDSAAARANRWAQQTGLELTSVAANSAKDDFVETIAVLTRTTPLPGSFAKDDAFAIAQLRELVAPLVSGEPDTTQVLPTPDGATRYAYAVWRHDVDLHVGLYPTDHGFALLIMAARSNESIIYDDMFARAFASVRGTAAPQDAFPASEFKTKVWIAGLGLTVGLYLLVFFALAKRSGDHGAAGTQTAIAMAVLGVAGSAATYTMLADVEVALTAAHATRTGLAVHALGAGLVGGALAYFVGAFARPETNEKVGAARDEVPLSVRLAQAEAERIASESQAGGLIPADDDDAPSA